MRKLRLLGSLALVGIMTICLEGCGSLPASQQIVPSVVVQQTVGTHPTFAETPGTLANQATPVRLIIPLINVNASIEALGITSSGELATPTQNPWENVGWYNAGPPPGERGSAVIDGHLDRPGGYPAVFWHLQDLHVGDAVIVKNAAGQTLQFAVMHIALYTPQSAPLQDIFGNSGGIYLNLITCAGDWIPDQHQTSLRLVVYTSLINGPGK